MTKNEYESQCIIIQKIVNEASRSAAEKIASAGIATDRLTDTYFIASMFMSCLNICVGEGSPRHRYADLKNNAFNAIDFIFKIKGDQECRS